MLDDSLYASSASSSSSTKDGNDKTKAKESATDAADKSKGNDDSDHTSQFIAKVKKAFGEHAVPYDKRS